VWGRRDNTAMDDWSDSWVPRLRTVEEALAEAAAGADELHLYQHDLGEVPAEVRGFRHLRRVHIYNARLRSLPEWLAELPELELIDAGRNELTEVPFALLCRPGLEVRIHENPLNLDRMFRMLIEQYNQARTEDVARACEAGIVMHLPRVRPANGTGHEAVARMLNDAYPRYGMVQVIETGRERAVLKPARAPQMELRLTWWSGRLREIEGGRCPR
jgi:hypothetical protein